MGSKRRLASAIIQQLPPRSEIGTYFEPFFGGGSVYFAYAPKTAILGDANPELMNAWRELRRDPHALRTSVAKLPTTSEDYYRVRRQAALSSVGFDRAVNFVYLNRNCFNGIYRTNKRNEFNVPFGERTGDLPTAAAFARCATLLASAQLVTGDFESTLGSAGAGDVVYLDPPWQTLRANYGEYGYSEHSEVGLPRIATAIRVLRDRGVDVYLSLPKEHAKIFDALKSVDLPITYNVDPRGASRTRQTELLLMATSESTRVLGAP